MRDGRNGSRRGISIGAPPSANATRGEPNHCFGNDVSGPVLVGEIKPLSLYGLLTGDARLYDYLSNCMGCLPEASWAPPRQPIRVELDGRSYPVWVFNGGGVLYYTDKYELAQDLATLTAVGRAILVRLMLKETQSFRAIGEPARIRALASFGTRVETARRDMHIQMASLYPSLRALP